jgi:anti-sigma B factor antagonist
LNVTIRSQNDVTIVHCQGRIVYRDEATALSDKIVQMLPNARKLIIDLTSVEMIDSAGLGELVVLYVWAQAKGNSIKLAAPDRRVREVLELTNLASVFPIHPTLDEALFSWNSQAA